MAGLFERLRIIFNAKADKALDKMEDPRETLDYSYQRQLELLQKVRRGVADVATSRCSALAKSWPFVTALLTAIVAVNVVNLVLARGNVKDISATIKPLPPSKPHSRRHHNTKHRKQQNV